MPVLSSVQDIFMDVWDSARHTLGLALYGKVTNAGDTAVSVTAGGLLKVDLSGTAVNATAVVVDSELPAAAALADATANPTTPVIGSFLHGFGGATWDRLRTGVSDGMAVTGMLASPNMLWNGASWDRMRTPTVFKSVAAVSITAGTPVTVWTPAAGKKFRLMGWALGGSAACSVIFKDGGTEFLRTQQSGVNAGSISPDLFNGFLSAVANNTLTLDVTASAALNGFLFGTEE